MLLLVPLAPAHTLAHRHCIHSDMIHESTIEINTRGLWAGTQCQMWTYIGRNASYTVL